jgi:hypothetical protein
VKRLIALLVALTSVLVAAPGAAANDTSCTGTLTGTHDNVVVPQGAICVLNAAMVRGNVKALQDSRLAVNFSNVGGSIEGDKADVVQVNATTVRENISIKEAGPPFSGPLPGGFFICAFDFGFTPCEALVQNTTVERGNIQLEKIHGTAWVAGSLLLSPIRGNIKVEDNLASPIAEFTAVTNNSVEQNVQVFKNKGPGNKLVSGNTVREDLQCFENDLPFVGAPNVARQVQGQCMAAPLPMAAAFSLFPRVVRLG